MAQGGLRLVARRAAAGLALLLGCATRLAAQQPRMVVMSSGRCTDSIPDSLFARDTVLLHAVIVDSTSHAFLPQAALLSQRVAHQLRALFDSGAAGALPSGEPRVSWHNDLDGNLEVTVRRSGPLTWKPLLPDAFPDTVPTALIARALAALVAGGRGGAETPWPEDQAGDHFSFRLVLTDSGPRSYSVPVGPGYPVFTLKVPRTTEPQLLSHPPVGYPEELRGSGLDGLVVLEAVIGVDGNVEPQSIHDVMPADQPRPADDFARFYRAFVREATHAVAGSHYRPASVAGCPARVKIRIPVSFRIFR